MVSLQGGNRTVAESSWPGSSLAQPWSVGHCRARLIGFLLPRHHPSLLPPIRGLKNHCFIYHISFPFFLLFLMGGNIWSLLLHFGHKREFYSHSSLCRIPLLSSLTSFLFFQLIHKACFLTTLAVTYLGLSMSISSCGLPGLCPPPSDYHLCASSFSLLRRSDWPSSQPMDERFLSQQPISCANGGCKDGCLH